MEIPNDILEKIVEHKYSLNEVDYDGILELGPLKILFNKSSFIVVEENLDKSYKEFMVEDVSIDSIEFVPQSDIVVFKNRKRSYYYSTDGEPIEGSENWEDHFYEPVTRSFYRKDIRGSWYDSFGLKLENSVFVKEHILCSLEGKKSKYFIRSEEDEFKTSVSGKYLQIGKVVLTKDLDLFTYLGEKVTSIGNETVIFQDGVMVQEVGLGFNEPRFIYDSTGLPFVINGEEVIAYHGRTAIRADHFYTFETVRKRYHLENSIDNLLVLGSAYHGSLDNVIEASDKILLIQNEDGNKSTYDLISKEKVQISNTDIISIEPTPISLLGEILFNIRTSKDALVLSISNDEAFTLNDGIIKPTRISSDFYLSGRLGFVSCNGEEVLFDVKSRKVIYLNDSFDTVSSIVSIFEDKLINVINSQGKKQVLDIRKGLDSISLIQIDGYDVSEVDLKSYDFGVKHYCNAKIFKLGGEEKIVVDLAMEVLRAVTFPNDIMQYSDQPVVSNFAGNHLIEIRASVIFKDEVILYRAKFLNMFNEIKSCLLKPESGRPLLLEGAGHRNELVQSIDDIDSIINVGTNQMALAQTLTDDQKDEQVLFSIDRMSSWLPFYEGFLPIMKKVVKIPETSEWKYHLIEVRSKLNEKEYLVVEKAKPYRILVENKANAVSPLLIKKKDKALKNPEEISLLRRFFMSDPGVLIEVM